MTTANVFSASGVVCAFPAPTPRTDSLNRRELIDFLLKPLDIRINGSLLRERECAGALGLLALTEEYEVTHINVTVPDELAAAAKAKGLCFSQLLQQTLRTIVSCEHDDGLQCARCGEVVERAAIEVAVLGRFCSDVFWAIEPAIGRGATGEGVARIVKDFAGRYDAAIGASLRTPRPTKAQRKAWSEDDEQFTYDRRRAS